MTEEVSLLIPLMQLPQELFIVFAVVAFVFGACVGSFLNVVIYRVPRGLSVNKPVRSFCPQCQQNIPWYYNIPLLSWLWLRGKGGCCGGRITVRYWWVELLSACLFCALWLIFPCGGVVGLMIWTAMGIVISFIDGEHLIVFPQHALLGIIGGLVSVMLIPSLLGVELWWEGLCWGLVGMFAGFLIIRLIMEGGKLLFGKKSYVVDAPTTWKIRDAQENAEGDEQEVCLLLGEQKIPWSFLFTRDQDIVVIEGGSVCVDEGEICVGTITISQTSLTCGEKTYDLEKVTSVKGFFTHAHIPREAMGSGDAYIMSMVCLVTGWHSIPLILLTASLLGIIVAIFQRMGWGTRIPFGPLLVAGGLFWLFYGRTLWELYLSMV